MMVSEIQTLKPGDLFQIFDPNGRYKPGHFGKLKFFDPETKQYEWQEHGMVAPIPHLSIVTFVGLPSTHVVVFLYDSKLFCSSGFHWMVPLDPSCSI